MIKKLLGPAIIFSLFVQIIFSFYYSSEIINQNNLLNNYQQKVDLLETQNSEFKVNLSRLTSLSYLESVLIDQGNYQLFTDTVTLNK